MIIAAIIATLVGGGVYLIMQRGMLRIIMGLTLLGHAVNLLILAAGIGAWRTEPLLDRATSGEAADPLPQAFVLTAIVISMATTSVMLALAALGRDDDTQSADDPSAAARKFQALETLEIRTEQPANTQPAPEKLGANDYCDVYSSDSPSDPQAVPSELPTAGATDSPPDSAAAPEAERTPSAAPNTDWMKSGTAWQSTPARDALKSVFSRVRRNAEENAEGGRS